MKPKDCSTKSKKYVHLSEKERYKIEGLLEAKKNIEEIAPDFRSGTPKILNVYGNLGTPYMVTRCK